MSGCNTADIYFPDSPIAQSIGEFIDGESGGLRELWSSLGTWDFGTDSHTATEEPQANIRDFLLNDYNVKDVEDDTREELATYDFTGPTNPGVSSTVEGTGEDVSATPTAADNQLVYIYAGYVPSCPTMYDLVTKTAYYKLATQGVTTYNTLTPEERLMQATTSVSNYYTNVFSNNGYTGIDDALSRNNGALPEIRLGATRINIVPSTQKAGSGNVGSTAYTDNQVCFELASSLATKLQAAGYLTVINKASADDVTTPAVGMQNAAVAATAQQADYFIALYDNSYCGDSAGGYKISYGKSELTTTNSQELAMASDYLAASSSGVSYTRLQSANSKTLAQKIDTTLGASGLTKAATSVVSEANSPLLNWSTAKSVIINLGKPSVNEKIVTDQESLVSLIAQGIQSDSAETSTSSTGGTN